MFLCAGRRARALILGAWLLSFLFCVPMLFLFNEANVEGKLRYPGNTRLFY